MDPFLERHREDVHTALIGYIRDALQPQLSEDPIARMEEKVYVEDESETRLRRVLIYDSIGNRVITAIKVLSPWNKSPGKAANEYLKKRNQRNQYINSEMNLVQIDLIRTGDWTDMIGPYLIPEKGRTTYRVTVTQPELTGPLHYPISIRAKLPTIKIPLREKDPPAKLNLQELIEKAYVMGRYNRIDYTKPCSPPLIGPEKIWVDEVLGAIGKR